MLQVEASDGLVEEQHLPGLDRPPGLELREHPGERRAPFTIYVGPDRDHTLEADRVARCEALRGKLCETV